MATLQSSPRKRSLATRRAKSQRTQLRGPGPLLWALDPLERDTSVIRSMRSFATTWSDPTRGFRVASVLSPFDLGWPVESAPELRAKLLEAARTNVSQLLQSAEPLANAPLLLKSKKISIMDAVQTLANQSARMKAELILVASHARKEDRWTGLGSFTERLITRVKTPVLVVTDPTVSAGPVQNVLFATDFSPASRKAFLKCLDWAERLGSRVTLFHHVGPLQTALAYGGAAVTVDPRWVAELWTQEKEMARRQAVAWMKAAEKRGIKAEFELDEEAGSIGEKIVAAASRERANVVALGVHRATWSQLLFGRCVRQVLAEASVPVLILPS